jgi:hypothetical protein
MKLLHILVLTVFLPAAALAETLDDIRQDAAGVTFAEFLWIKRPVLVFADSPNDPAFAQQIEYLADDAQALADRDVVVITDTNPAGKSNARIRFRPRGFSLVLMDKDGGVEIRKPRPWDVREITRAIDKFPLARQEVLEKYPSGR